MSNQLLSSAIGCPLCGSAFIERNTNSNNWVLNDGVKVTGVGSGNPDMTAKCARGCLIRVQACQPLGPYAELGAGKSIAEYGDEMERLHGRPAGIVTETEKPPTAQVSRYDREPEAEPE